MAYAPTALRKAGMTFVGENRTNQKWFYVTADALLMVEGAGYFTDARIKKADVIEIVYLADATPGVITKVVTAVTSAGVATIA